MTEQTFPVFQPPPVSTYGDYSSYMQAVTQYYSQPAAASQAYSSKVDARFRCFFLRLTCFESSLIKRDYRTRLRNKQRQGKLLMVWGSQCFIGWWCCQSHTESTAAMTNFFYFLLCHYLRVNHITRIVQNTFVYWHCKSFMTYVMTLGKNWSTFVFTVAL